MSKQAAFFCAVLVASLNSALALADTLEGEVKQNVVRISRPAQALVGKTSGTTLRPSVSENEFNLEATENAAALAAQSASTDMNCAAAETALPAVAPQSPLTGAAQSTVLNAGVGSTTLSANASTTLINAGTTAGAGGSKSQREEPNYDYNAKKPLQGSVTFRICYYDLGDGAECAWEAMRDANYLLGRGVDIAIMLDRGGVRLANRHNAHEYQLHRGSTEQLVKTQQMFRQFIDKGGKVFVSERWAKTFGLVGGSYQALTPGVDLLGDEEMADLLVERSGRIVDY